MMDRYLISKTKSIQDAIEQLDLAMGLGLIVVDKNNTLLGSLTDGDIRRAITSEKKLTDSVESIMFTNPTTGNKKSTTNELTALTKNGKIKLIPIVENNIVIDVHTISLDEVKDIPVVLMAGGLGSRLGELTKDCPKPMLEVGGKPVLERIIDNFTRVGFKKFFISVNYKAHMIEDYFKNGAKFNCEIEYLREKERLGTAGSLSLLPEDMKGSMVVMNGDLLTLVDFRRLISFHNNHDSKITMCTRKFDIQVPYGVVNIENETIKSMEEKPVHSFNVNAGVYVMDSSLLKYIPKNKYFDMPSFVDNAMENNNSTHCFPMIEKWIDIGKASDLEFARKIYGEKND